MEDNNNQNSTSGAYKDRNSSDITAIIDEVIARVKRILNDFEVAVEEAFTFFEMLRSLFQEIKDLFYMRGDQARSNKQMELA